MVLREGTERGHVSPQLNWQKETARAQTIKMRSVWPEREGNKESVKAECGEAGRELLLHGPLRKWFFGKMYGHIIKEFLKR